MDKNSSDGRRIPGFTAESALEQRTSPLYAGLARPGVAGGAVEPARPKQCSVYTAPPDSENGRWLVQFCNGVGGGLSSEADGTISCHFCR